MIVNQQDINNLIQKDKLFEKILELYGKPPQWKRPGGFVSLCKIILEQQVSLESAKAHFNRLNNHIKIFNPNNILQLSDAEMRSCQISKQKSKYLKELSLAILENRLNLDELIHLTNDDIYQKLMTIKGIGKWTVSVYLLFCLQRKDVFPVGDIALINTLKELVPTIQNSETEQYSVNWKPYRSLAVFFLWHYYLNKRNRTALII